MCVVYMSRGRVRVRKKEIEKKRGLLIENETEGTERRKKKREREEGTERENRVKRMKDGRPHIHAPQSRQGKDRYTIFPINYGRFCQIVPFGETDENSFGAARR